MKNYEFAFTLNAMMQGNVVTTSKEAYRALEQMNQAMGVMKSKYQELSVAQGLARADINKYKSAMRQLKAEYESGGISTATYNIKLEDLQRKLNAASLRAQGLSTELKKVSSDMRNYNSMKDIGVSRGNFNASTQNAMGAYASYQGAMSTVQQITAPLVDGIKEAMAFESAMADVKKVVDFPRPQGFKDMQQDILNLTSTLPMIPQDIAKIVAAGGQAGIPREELMKFAESAAKMGVAFDVTAEQAGDMMAKWRTAFKMNQSDVVSLADKINYLGNTTAASAPLISDVVTRIGPLGEVGGVASGEIAALGASMVGTGVQSEVAATGIKNLILGMTAGEGATKTQAAAFQTLGLDAAEMAKKMQVDAKGAILEVLTALKALPKEKQAAVLSDLFGTESIGAISPLLSNLDALQANFNKVGDSSKYAGSMEAEFKARSETTENAMILMQNAFKRINIEIGNVFLPMLSQAMQSVSQIATKFADWASQHQKLAMVIGGTVVGVSALTIGISALGLVFAGVKTAYTGFIFLKNAIAGVNVITAITTGTTRTFQAVQAMGRLTMMGFSMASTVARTAMIGLNAAMVANPVGLVIAGIAALIAIGYVLINNFAQVQAFMTSIWESPIAALAAFCIGPIGVLIYLASGIIANWESVQAYFSQLWDNPSAAIDQFVAFFQGKLQGMLSTAMEFGNKIANALSFNFGSGSGGGQDVSHNADGGIYRKGAFLTTFAEESPEAAIPLDGSRRAVSLWQQAGQILGMLPEGGPSPASEALAMAGGISTASAGSTGSNTSNQNVSISIPITINGNADSSMLGSIQDNVKEAVLRALEEIRHDESRVSFA